MRRHWNWPNWRHVWLRCHAETPICRKCHTRRWRDERIVQHLCTAQLPDCTCAQSTYVHRQSNTCTQTCNIPDIGSMHTSSCQLIVTVLMKFPPPPKSFAQDLVLVQLTLMVQKIIKNTHWGLFRNPSKCTAIHYSVLQCNALYWPPMAQIWPKVTHSDWLCPGMTGAKRSGVALGGTRGRQNGLCYSGRQNKW